MKFYVDELVTLGSEPKSERDNEFSLFVDVGK